MDKRKILLTAGFLAAAATVAVFVLSLRPGPNQARYSHLCMMLVGVIYLLVLPLDIMKEGLDNWHPNPIEVGLGIIALIEGFKGFYWFVFSF